MGQGDVYEKRLTTEMLGVPGTGRGSPWYKEGKGETGTAHFQSTRTGAREKAGTGTGAGAGAIGEGAFMRSVFIAILLFLFTLPSFAAAERNDAEGNPIPEDLPEAFQSILPRGVIPAIDDPRFVTPAESEIPDSAMVIGVAIGGEARAYDINLLNEIEVVNDRIGGTPFAAVW